MQWAQGKIARPLMLGAYLVAGGQGNLGFVILAEFQINLMKLVMNGAILICRGYSLQLPDRFLEPAQLSKRPTE